MNSKLGLIFVVLALAIASPSYAINASQTGIGPNDPRLHPRPIPKPGAGCHMGTVWCRHPAGAGLLRVRRFICPPTRDGDTVGQCTRAERGY